MNRYRLEQAIAEVGRRTQLDYFYVIGSAAVFACLPDMTDEALVATRDVDVIPSPPLPADIDRFIDQIDMVLGEGSPFDDENGWYVQGVDFTTPGYAPRSWKERVIPVRSASYTGLCMEIHDLVLSKYGIGREKDLDFTRVLAKSGRINQETLLNRLHEINAETVVVERIAARIRVDFS
ncbi:MAG: DUF6036 family nucleotidyltransferase [Gammaproteobacteria bacterium]